MPIKRDILQSLFDLPASQRKQYKRNPAFLLQLIRSFPDDLDLIVNYCMDRSLRKDVAFMIRAIKYNSKMMRYASYDLCDELDFIYKAYKTNPHSILYLPKKSYVRYPQLARLR